MKKKNRNLVFMVVIVGFVLILVTGCNKDKINNSGNIAFAIKGMIPTWIII